MHTYCCHWCCQYLHITAHYMTVCTTKHKNIIKIDVPQYRWFDFLMMQLTHQVINKCNSIALFLPNVEYKDGHIEFRT